MSFQYFLYILIFLVAFFDPQNGLGCRQVLLFSFIPLWLYGLKVSLGDLRGNVTEFVLCYGLPLWGLVVYLFRGTGTFAINDTSYISFALVYSIVFILREKRSQCEFNKASILAGNIFSCIMLYTAIELLLSGDTKLIDYVIDKDIARISFREYAGVNIPYVYYYASTLLILPMAIILSEIKQMGRWSQASLILMTSAMFLSGTRSHIAIAVIFTFLYLKALVGRSIYLFAAMFALVAGMEYSDLLLSMYGTSESTNSQKISMLSLYYSIFGDPVTILFGQGFQAVDWSSELQQMVYVDDGATKTELTYVELFRVFGFLLPTLIFSAFFHRLTKKRSVMSGYKRLAMMMLIFDSALNPHLFSTYGALVLAVSMSRLSGANVINIHQASSEKRLSVYETK